MSRPFSDSPATHAAERPQQRWKRPPAAPKHQQPRTPSPSPAVAPTLRLTGHRPALDGVRGVAILMVLVYHFLPSDLPANHGALLGTWSFLAGFGGSGVDLFFVLSGFLITGILLDARETPGYFRNFYARRSLRIVPLYYGVLAAFFVLLPYVHRFSQGERVLAEHQGWLWTYTSNFFDGRFADWQLTHGRLSFDHFWSLCVEEHFYLVWPIAVYLLGRRALAWCCAAMIAGAFALRWALYAHNDPTLAFYVWTPCRMDGLAAGALLALVARRPDEGAGLRRWALPMIAAAVAWIAITWRDPFARGCVYATSQMVLAFAGMIILAVTSGPRHPLTRLLTSGPLIFFGKYSYAIYVLHLFLLRTIVARIMSLHLLRDHLAHSGLARTAMLLVLGLACSAAAGWLSWHLFEKHFLKLKRHFEYRQAVKA